MTAKNYDWYRVVLTVGDVTLLSEIVTTFEDAKKQLDTLELWRIGQYVRRIEGLRSTDIEWEVV